MNGSQLQAAITQVFENLSGQVTDCELLERFVTSQDQAAFTELAKRHGPKVYAVCRRILGHHQTTEDAFQATFIVLAKKAASIHPRSSVGSFIYGVARNAALKVRDVSYRRRELLMETVPDRSGENRPIPETDTLAILDEEIIRLSETLRAPVLLCELDGMSRADAARQLGINEGTLSSRLAAARKQLALRLKKRGVILTTSLILAWAESAHAYAPALLHIQSPIAILIAEGVLKAMIHSKLKLLTIAMLAMVTFTLSSLAGSYGRVGHEADDSKMSASNRQNGYANLLFLARDHRYYSMSPAGEQERRLTIPRAEITTESAQPSWDGKRLAYWVSTPIRSEFSLLAFADILGNSEGEPAKLPKSAGYRRFCWSRDGNTIYVSQSSLKRQGGVDHYTVDVKTHEVKELNILHGHLVIDFSKDEKQFLTLNVGETNQWSPNSIHLMNRDGSTYRTIVESKEPCQAFGLSPDGSKVLCLIGGQLTVISVDKPESKIIVEGIPKGETITSATWSPDGNRIAYTTGTFQFLNENDMKELNSRLLVADPTEKNTKTIRAVTGENMSAVFWR